MIKYIEEVSYKRAKENYLKERGWMWMAICHGNTIVVQHRWIYLGDEKLYECVDLDEAFKLQIKLEETK